MGKFTFKLPDIGEGIAEAEIVAWHVAVGDRIEEDQPLADMMTDKATVVIPSPKRGKVTKTWGKEGEIAKVHHPLVTIELEGGAPAEKASNGHAAPAPAPAPAAAPKAMPA